jgi:predicted transcriptional regulator
MAGSVQMFTPERVIDALRDARGVQTRAARLLGWSRLTVANYVERYPSIQAEIQQIREELKDELESTLLDKALVDRDTTSVIYALKTYARDRGHGVQESNVNLSGTVRVQVELPDSMRTPPQPLGPIPRADDAARTPVQVFQALPGALLSHQDGQRPDQDGPGDESSEPEN